MTFIDIFSNRRLARPSVLAGFGVQFRAWARGLGATAPRLSGRLMRDIDLDPAEIEAARILDPLSSSLTKIHSGARGPLA